MSGYTNTVECTVRVPAPSARYLDELFKLKCAQALVPLFPNAKEITESFAVFHAIKKALGPALLADPSVTVICPGDGTQPRTGALFALRSKWTVFSVDPIMRPRHVNGRHFIERLHAIKDRAGQFPVGANRVIVAACHSHAPLSQVLAPIRAERIDVASLPCCVPDDIGEPSRTYLDRGCWSPHNRINLYLDWRHA